MGSTWIDDILRHSAYIHMIMDSYCVIQSLVWLGIVYDLLVALRGVQ